MCFYFLHIAADTNRILNVINIEYPAYRLSNLILIGEQRGEDRRVHGRVQNEVKVTVR